MIKTKRPKAGRPPLPAGQKKVAINIKLHPRLILFIDSIGRNRTKTIEQAIVDKYGFAPEGEK
jgi:hypothetical protein